MKILITNNEISKKTGSELYVKELAEQLTKIGHQVAIYSDCLGELAKEIRKSKIEITDDLATLSFKPDIIHGQHHLETMTAVTYFHDVPAIYFCHGWRPWQSTPPKHPRIIEYAAVDSKTLNSAVKNAGISSNKIRIIHNFVDTERFQQRSPLPEKPEKALIFSNYANEDNYIPIVRKACSRANIKLDVIGMASNNSVEKPELILKDYDIVFAFGRSSLEALATGNALIICGIWGLGPMVQSTNMEKLRDLNFGVAAVYSELNEEAIYKEIQKYNAKDSAKVTEYIRSHANIVSTVAKIEKFYFEVLEKYQKIKINPVKESLAVSKYLEKLTFLIKQSYTELAIKGEEINRLSKQNIEVSQAIEELRFKLLEAERAFKKQNRKINFMQASKFWKLRKKYLDIKNFFKEIKPLDSPKK